MNFIIDKNEYFIIIKDQHLRMVKQLHMHFCLESEPKNTGRKTDKKERKKKGNSTTIIRSCNVLLSKIYRNIREKISRYVEQYARFLINFT